MVDTIPKPFVFVLMPFESKYDDIYKLGIKKACENAGAYAERVDEQYYEGSITQRIYNQIDKADIIVADMTDKNPNVFYETGYAHALGKNVILLTQESSDIPFDLKDYPHIVYEGKISEILLPELEKRVRWATEHSQEIIKLTKFPVRLYIERVPLENNPTIKYPIESPHRVFKLDIDINNSDEEILRIVSLEFSVITSNRFTRADYMKRKYCTPVRLPDKNILHIIKDKYNLLPGSWQKIYMTFIAKKAIEVDVEENFIIRIFTDQGGYDYPFVLKIVEKQK